MTPVETFFAIIRLVWLNFQFINIIFFPDDCNPNLKDYWNFILNDTENKTVDVIAVSSLAGFGIRRAALAIGVFDGVHLGHQLLLARLLDMARELDAVPCALTFSPHPRQVLAPEKAPPLLLEPEQKARLLHGFGMTGVVTLPFTREFASQTPDAFIADCLYSDTVEVAGIAVGANWRFGRGGCGGVADLERIAAQKHFRLVAVPELRVDGQVVSSTAIRRAVAGGLLDRAAGLLGRNYSLTGTVVRGYRVASSELSHPTANLDVCHGVLPPNGVYAGLVHLDGQAFDAAVNIGECPTFHRSGAEVRVEVHVLDFSGDLYGCRIELELLRYLREERTFGDSLALRQQIAEDVREIRRLAEQHRK
jgi:riboflavin kinase/FMN adenylyltransferase